MFYAGIGSRLTPADICDKLTLLASHLEKLGYVLRSGGAGGADTAFEKGVVEPKNKVIWKAQHATYKAIEFASAYHPAWQFCSDYARKLHGRNAMIILGEELNEPTKLVVCWSPSDDYGGTAMGIKIAKAHNIPVFNFSSGVAIPSFLKEGYKTLW